MLTPGNAGNLATAEKMYRLTNIFTATIRLPAQFFHRMDTKAAASHILDNSQLTQTQVKPDPDALCWTPSRFLSALTSHALLECNHRIRFG